MGLFDRFRAPPASALERLASRPTTAVRVMTHRPAPIARSLRSTVFDNPGFQGGWSLIRGDMPTFYQGTGRNVRTKGWEQHPVVNACARAIVDIVGAVPIEVCLPTADDTLDAVPDTHPAQQLLDAPRVAMSGYRLRALTGLHFVLYGNAFWILEGNDPTKPRGANELPSAIRLIHPEHVHHVWLDPETTEIAQYDWRDRWGLVHHSPVQDVLHFMDLAGMDWLFGFPRAAAALQDIVADGEATQYVRQIVRNDGTPTTVFLAEGMNDKELVAARERYYERVATRGERGRAEFMGGIKDVKALGFNLNDLEFPELRQITREDICTAFGVDPRMIGIGSATQKGRGGMNSKEFEEARYKLVQHTVKPLMETLASQINLWLMPEFSGKLIARFDPAALYDLTENETETWTRVGTAVSQTILTREEGRKRLKAPADQAKTDTLVLGPKTVVETVKDALAPPEPASTPGTPAAPGEPAGGKRKGEAAIPAQATDDEPVRMARLATDRAELWRMADARAQRLEQPYRQAALMQFEVERQGVRALFAKALGQRQVLDEWGQVLRALMQLYASVYAVQWRDRFADLIGGTVEARARELAQELQVELADPSARVSAAITGRATRLADTVPQTTLAQIRSILDTGHQAGMSLKDTADVIDQTVFGSSAPVRAERIARTETIGAQNEAEYLAALLSGVAGTKEWLTQGDERVRDSHAAVDGERVAMTEHFGNGCLYPGDPSAPADEIVNCRCTLLFHPHVPAAAGIPGGGQEPSQS